MSQPWLPPAGWYPDPQGPGSRYWNGTAWAPAVPPTSEHWGLTNDRLSPDSARFYVRTAAAKALGVSREAIKKDIAELEASGSLVRSTKPNRPKGGRPPKEPKKPVTCERTKKTAPSHTSWGPHSSSFRGAG